MSWYVEKIECWIDAYAKTYHGANYDKDNQADYYLMSNPYQKSNQTISWGPHYMIWVTFSGRTTHIMITSTKEKKYSM